MLKGCDHQEAGAHTQLLPPQIVDVNQDMLQEHNSVHLPEFAGEDDGSQEYDEGIQLDDDDDPGPYLDSQQYDSAQTYQGEDYPTEDQLQLCFVPQTHHYEFWDMREQDLFVCYAQLQLLFKDPARWNKSRGKPECPEPKFVRLECSIAPTTPRDTRYDPHNDYREYDPDNSLYKMSGSIQAGNDSTAGHHPIGVQIEDTT
ncbi:hypothetical protein BDN72DRAFT_858144 [Pluteus cervinus]|uniref:Uncharacterized protein n=1 Tax=Pluteus cervinus TaxID=181527 RepID=A0ACD3ATF3_9AGAR|nr:hypothetical protein BDN72DRAFT_858144 [Pluteus cervinus]